MSGRVHFSFEVGEERGGGYSVRLTVDGEESAEGAFEFDLEDPTTGDLLERIDHSEASLSDLQYVGSVLWAGLVNGDVEELFKRKRDEGDARKDHYRLQLGVPVSLSHLPWETLFDERDARFFVTHRRYTLFHTPPGMKPAPPVEPARGPIRILAVIPSGSGLTTEREVNNLRRGVARLGESIRVEPLRGSVTPRRLRDAVLSKEWDAVHYIGHGRPDPETGNPCIRLNDEESEHGEIWLDGEQLRTIFDDSGVRLVMLNSCYGETGFRRSSLSGFGPHLLAAGVPAVIAMRYEILDTAAVRLSAEFYRTLFDGRRAGKVHWALEEARNDLFLNKRSAPETVRSFITPVLYLADADAELFRLVPTTTLHLEDLSKETPSRPPAPPSPAFTLLAKAVRQGRCIPVVGSGLLNAGVSRSSAAPGPLELARKLAEACDYPQPQDFETCERAGEWMEPMVLQWVAQHFLRRRRAYELLDLLKAAYEKSEPSLAMMRLAEWDCPGIICTHFDGLMEVALKRLGRAVQVVNFIDQASVNGAKDPLLVNLRGSMDELDSLVVTEDRQDQLFHRLRKPSPPIVDLTRGHGHSLLFLGVCPREALVRQLGRQLLIQPESETLSTQGPAFIACPQRDEVEEGYWAKFGVLWIEDDLAHLVESLHRESTAGPPEVAT